MSFGERMQQRRKELGLSIVDLAHKTKRCRQTLHRYENGAIRNVPIDVIVLLARALDTTPNWLLGWDDKAGVAKR